MTKKQEATPNAETRSAMAEAEGIVRTRLRLATMAKVLETDLTLLEPFLDFLAEEELTDRRIVDAQWILGLCTPICSHLQFPKMEPPSVGRELLAEWLRRQADRISLSPEDQAVFVEAILNPPPLAPAMERAFKRRAELLDLQEGN